MKTDPGDGSDAQEIVAHGDDAAEKDSHVLYGRRQDAAGIPHTVPKFFLNFRQGRRKIHRKGRIDDQDFGIEGIEDIVNSDSDVFDEILHAGNGIGIAVFIKSCEFISGEFPEMFFCGDFFQDGVFGGILFETAAVSAGAGTSVRDNDGVAEFSGIAVMADIETVIQDKAQPDSGMDRNIYDIFCRITECMLAYGREIGFIFNEDGDAEGTAEMAGKVHLLIIAVRRKKNFAFMDDTVDADGNPNQPVAGLRPDFHEI